MEFLKFKDPQRSKLILSLDFWKGLLFLELMQGGERVTYSLEIMIYANYSVITLRKH